MKTAAYLIFDQDGVPLGHAPDAPVPRFRAGVDGIDPLTIELPRVFGRLDEPGEPGSGETIVHGNRVQVWVTDPERMTAALTPALVGLAAVGEAAIEQESGLGELIWSGTLEAWTPTPPHGVTLELVPLDRILAETEIDGVFTGTGDVVAVARQVVDGHVFGLAWDSRNPDTAGVTIDGATWDTPMAVTVLADLMALAGPGWRVFVTPRGTVRCIDPAQHGDSHVLIDGIHTTDLRLQKDGLGLAAQVTVAYATGRVTERAADWRTADPRAKQFDAAHLTTEGDARRLAQLLLERYNRVELRGTCTVLGTAYDLESLHVGDTVRLQVPRDSGELVTGALVGFAVVGEASVSVGGYLDYDQPLTIAGIDYQFDRAVIELSLPRPGLERQLAAMMKSFAALQQAAF